MAGTTDEAEEASAMLKILNPGFSREHRLHLMPRLRPSFRAFLGSSDKGRPHLKCGVVIKSFFRIRPDWGPIGPP
jgi:hypothetical protein